MSSKRSRRTRSESGAIAIMFAIMAAMLLGIAAMGVDIGNAYQRRREVQTQADLAALSAASNLPNQAATVSAVTKYLNLNKKIGQSTVVDSQLTDGKLWNGEVVFSGSYKMTVYAPQAQVDFGLARALRVFDSTKSFAKTEVNAAATVAAGTPGATAEMPFYTVSGSGCDWGSQTLSDPANGQVQSTVPTLASPTTNPTQTSNASLTSLTPSQVDLNATTATLTINGSQLASVNRIVFLRTTTESPNVAEVVVTTNTNNNMVSSVPVPTSVTSQAGVWWVRVYKASGNIGWSPVSKALPFRVGEGVITCPGASNSGNFGSLILPRTDSTNATSNGWLPNNIASGLQAPLSLAVDPGAASPWTCTPGTGSVVYSTTTGTPSIYPGTNCVDTDTGLPATSATAGLITGTNLFSGRLAGKATTTGVLTSGTRNGNCGPGHTSASRSVLGFNINNDVLSCFMNDPTMPLSTIASSTYSGGPALDPAIYSSPRFCYVPVVSVHPSTGGSQHYSVTDMRPCFITGESNTSTYNNQQIGDGSDNGLTIPVNKVTSIRVFFFNKNALPAIGSVGDYIGTGPKAVALVQ